METLSGNVEVWGLANAMDADDAALEPDAPLASDREEDDVSEPDTWDGGFGDSKGIVRLWLDGDRLIRVRVSTRWREKLEDRTLDQCFGQALAAANLRIAEIPAYEEPDVSHIDFSRFPRFSPTAMEVFEELFLDVQKRWDEAVERRQTSSDTPLPTTSGRSKGVTVELDAGGRATGVSFDPTWLKLAETVSIRSHVLRAFERARARFTPAEDDRGEIDAIETEHRILLTAFRAMLNPKEQS